MSSKMSEELLADEIFGTNEHDLPAGKIRADKMAPVVASKFGPFLEKNPEININPVNMTLSSSLWYSGEWLWQPVKSERAIPYYFHVKLFPDTLQLPVYHSVEFQELDNQMQTINLIVSRSFLPSADFSSSKRLMYLPKALENGLKIAQTIDFVNRLYVKPVFKLHVLIDLALSSRDLSKKYLSKLVSSVNQDLNAECYVYNSNSPVAVSNNIAFATDTRKYRFNRSDLLRVLSNSRINHMQKEDLPLSMASATKPLTEFGLVDLTSVKDAELQLTPMVTNVEGWVEKPDKYVAFKASKSKAKTVVKTDLAKPESEVKSVVKTKPKPVDLDHLRDHDTDNRDLFDYSTNASVTDVIRRHMRKDRTFNPNVVIERVGKPRKQEDRDEDRKE